MFVLIDDHDLEDFQAAVRANGHDTEYFALTEKVIVRFGVEKGAAIVRSKGSEAERFYPLGHGTVFPADFAEDLRRGFLR